MAYNFVQRLNIDRFQRLLLSEANPKKRAAIERLLAEERTKDDEAQASDGVIQQGDWQCG